MKCKLKNNRMPFDRFKHNRIFKYVIESDFGTIFCYHIYDEERIVAMFSKEFFNINFIDIVKERKEKLNKLKNV